MKTQVEMESISDSLFKYLSDEVVGSEKVVRYRRLYYKLNDDILSNTSEDNYTWVSSGSKAEGLDLNGSDIDLMLVSKFWEVYESIEQKHKNEKNILILDIENASPGFALLKVANNSAFPCLATKTANGNLISNSEFLDAIYCKESREFTSADIHGPCCATSSILDIDLVVCLLCHTWPTVTKQWFYRCRQTGWPSPEIISNIASQGALLVPIGSKSSCNRGNHFEWRFSFSLSEKLLVHSFNHCQLLCYALLKIWLKEVLNQDNILNNTLCSYYMKTVLFWILEEDEKLYWIPKNLLHCFLLCIKRLQYWILIGYIPNYFIPEYNMIHGKFSHDILAYLALHLDKLNKSGRWAILFSAQSLRDFHNTLRNIPRYVYCLTEFDKAMLTLQNMTNLILCGRYILGEKKLSAFILYRMIHKCLPRIAKQMLTVLFLKENKIILTSLNILNNENKHCYRCYKICLSRILINSSYDALCGWLILAAFFYSTHEYQKVPYVLKLSAGMLSLRKLFTHDYETITSFRAVSKLKKIVCSGSFIKRMKYEISRVFQIYYVGSFVRNYQFLSEDFNNIGQFGGQQSVAMFHFIKFLYNRKQGNTPATKSSLQLLKQAIVEEQDKWTDIVWLALSISLLCRACELSNDMECFKTYGLEFLNKLNTSDILKYEMHKDIRIFLELE